MKKAVFLFLFLGAVAHGPGGDKPHMSTEDAFKKLDTDGSGTVSLAEFLEGPAARKDPAKAKEWYKKKNTSNDDKLTLDQFKAAPKPGSSAQDDTSVSWFNDLWSHQMTTEERIATNRHLPLETSWWEDLTANRGPSIRDYLELSDAPVVLRERIVVEKGEVLLIRNELTKCVHFEAQDGARIILSPKLREWTLESQTATFGKGVVIDGTGVNGKPGKDGSAGTPGKNGPTKVKGSAAKSGGPGQDGAAGLDGVNVSFRITGKLTVGEVKFALKGGDSGTAGSGGDGGRGANAAVGKGGSDGSNGGDSGNGGDAGNGGHLAIFYGDGGVDGISVLQQAGKAGSKGRSGSRGIGGKARPGDPVPFPFGRGEQYINQPGGTDGENGREGEPGRSGLDGKSDFEKI